jgi:hypothetical protein
MKAIASAVDKKVAEKMKAMENENAIAGETEAYIMSIFKKMQGGNGQAQISNVAVSPSASAPTASTLKGILKRVKNGQK